MSQSLRSSNPALISVITPTLNQGQFIEQTIQSVLRQNYSYFEHIVVDGGSTDNTLELLKRYPHIRWISEKDRGQSDALNKGLQMANGEIIAWLNSDDYYAENAFRRIFDTFQNNRDAMVIVGDCMAFVDGSDKMDRLFNRELGFEDMIRYWDGWLPPHQPSVFFKAELVRQLGNFDITLHHAMDYDFWLRISQKYRFLYIPEILSYYRFHKDSKSGMGQDWSSFYLEWHQVYLRYKPRSRILPQKTMITVAFPLSRVEDSSRNGALAVRESILSLQGQRFRDMEILVVTDADPNSETLRFSESSLPVRIVPIPKFSNHVYKEAVCEHAESFALYFAVPGGRVPDQWFAQAVDLLLDHPELKRVSDVSENQPSDSKDSNGETPGPSELWRLDAFQPYRYKLSVIIPTCNRSQALKLCLDSLSRQTLPADAFEVIVVDDGSTDDTAKFLEQYSSPFPLIRIHQKNRGPAAARNAAIKRCKGEYVLILNDDAIPAHDLLQKHLNTHEKLGNTKAAVLGSFPFSAEFLESPFMELMQKSDFAFQYSRMTPGQFYDWKYFWTCNISLRKSALNESGLFDEDFREPAGEDNELGYRLWQKGYKVLYDPSCKAEHYHQLSLIGFSKRQVSVGRNLILFCLKHPRLAKELIYFPNIFEAREEAAEWLEQNEKVAQKAFRTIAEAEETQTKQLEKTGAGKSNAQDIQNLFQTINRYWIYQGFLNGVDRSGVFPEKASSPARNENELRITFMLPGTSLSGGTKIVLEYCNRLVARGHKVNICSLTPDRPEWFPLNSGVRYLTSGWSDLRLEYDLPEADFVIATQWSTAYFVARLTPTKGAKLYFIQSYESETITTPELADPTYILPLERLTVSSWLSNKMKNRFGVQTTVIPNGIDPDFLFPDLSIREKSPKSEFRVGMIHHTEPRKGYDVGLQAFHSVKASIPEARLILTGTSPPADKKQFDEFFENLAPSEVRRFFCSLDVFVSPSYQEGFGLPGLESQACGIPLITTDSGGVREYAVDGKTALVCPAGDPKSIAEALMRLSADNDLREKLRSGGFEISKTFNWARSVEMMENYFHERLRIAPPPLGEVESELKMRPAKSEQFYSKTSTAPLTLRLFWRIRDKVQRWKLRCGYLLARRFK